MNHESATQVSAPQRIGVGLGAVLVLLAVASVAYDTHPAPPYDPATTPHGGQAPRPSPSTAARAVLPDLVGLDLQQARHTAEAAGFRLLTSYDAATEDQLPAFDSTWKVCAQTPRPGAVRPTLTDVALSATERTEPCPR